MKLIREKPHRLPDAAYRGRRCVAFTACEANRQPNLANDQIHLMIRETLARAADMHRCAVPVYCLMPDHLHVLLLGLADDSDAKAAMVRFKRDSGMWFAEHRPDLSWQQDFYDQIVRRADGYDHQTRYIALNPVRRGLADDIFGWPYTGSIGYDLAEVLLDAWWT